MADRAWKLRLWPTPLMVATLRTAAPQRILTIGLLSTVILAIANFLLAQRQARLGQSLRRSERLTADVEATRRHLSDLVNGIEAVIWESDAGVQHFTFVNDYARKLLGIDTDRWVAEPAFWYENVHPDDRARARENSQAARRLGQSQPIEYRMIDAAGQILWVREIITAIENVDHVEGLRGVVVDITARVQAEEALRQSQKLESLGVLAGGIAHDFNNLLTTILGNAEMLTPYLATAKAGGKHHLEKIERTTRRLADLTRQMLAYSGRGKFTVDKLDLNLVIVEMTDLLKVSTPKNVRVTYQLAPALPLIEADPVQIRQVILNLLTNATEAIGDQRSGSVIIRTGHQHARRRHHRSGVSRPGAGARRLRAAGGQRQRLRHERRNFVQDFRPVLHDEIRRARPGIGGLARHRAGTPRGDSHRQSRGRGHGVHVVVPRAGDARNGGR